MNLFQEELPDDRLPELIEPEIIEVTAHKRERKAKATYEEMFDNLPRRQVVLDTLTNEEKQCPLCETPMVSIGTEVARTELVFHPAYLERVDYIATTYECPACKDSLEPQFIKDEGKEPLVPHSYVSSGLAAHLTPIIVYQYHPTRNGDAAVMHTSGDTLQRRSLKERKRTIPIRLYRDFSIAINYSNTSGATVKKVSPISRYAIAVSRTRNLL